jgi:hypothetical protein
MSIRVRAMGRSRWLNIHFIIIILTLILVVGILVSLLIGICILNKLSASNYGTLSLPEEAWGAQVSVNGVYYEVCNIVNMI